MLPLIFKIIIYINTTFIIFISFFLLLSKKNEPKEFPEKFKKVYSLKHFQNAKNNHTYFN